MVESAYIHIPFCKSKCKYCSFTSFTDFDYLEKYFIALEKEINYYYNGEKLKTLYFGGGTPSLVPINHLKNIIEKFNFNENCEITLELNPDDATYEYLNGLINIGINRLSIGAQTFDDKILKLIGRRHDSNAILNSIDLAKKAGFTNISLDLIYGLPAHTREGLKKDINNILNLDIQHISTYGLKIETNSYWGLNKPSDLPDDDEQADMYEYINNEFEKNNYNRYEISNFAKKGYESQHNLNYWNNSEYYGFGISAHGYINRVRYSNYLTFDEYLKKPIAHKKEHYVSKEENIQEEIFLGFRKSSGIDINNFRGKFDIDFEKEYAHILNKYLPKYIEKTPQGYKLTLQGVLLSNIILSDFI